jgi:HJR/Mrr/RecB family endonuclease
MSRSYRGCGKALGLILFFPLVASYVLIVLTIRHWRVVLWAFVFLYIYPLLFVLILTGLSIYGAVLGAIGAILVYTSPATRNWLMSQPGYVRFLSKFPGMRSSSPLVMAIATAFLLVPWSLLIVPFATSPNETGILSVAGVGLIGVFLLYGWLVRGWRLPFPRGRKKSQAPVQLPIPAYSPIFRHAEIDTRSQASAQLPIPAYPSTLQFRQSDHQEAREISRQIDRMVQEAEERRKAEEERRKRAKEEFDRMVQEAEERRKAEEERRKKAEEDYFKRIKRLDEIKSLTPIEFERYVGRFFEQIGYNVQATATTGDEGVDLFLRKNNKIIVVQCKKYDGTVGQPVVRELYGAMIHHRADEAYLITTGTISMPAQRWAANKPIQLVDGMQLLEWIETFEQTSSKNCRNTSNLED